MRFKDLYKIVDAVEAPPVLFDELVTHVRNHHLGVGTVKVYAVKGLSPNHQAHFRLIDCDRTSSYDEEFRDVEITYCESLDAHPRERRYALTKELMHVFDTREQLVDSRDKFIKLLKEIQNKPMPAHASPAFNAELDTRWMAAIILCPKRFRDQHVEEYRKDVLQDFDIAELFRIPEWVVPFVMDDYYEEAFDLLINQ
ncbi:hypothetical protein [Allosphingosinicella deserti]|uniref:Uncharacterized protein n=1 Tax=Allosphingosinicella deserti TaxID=2116704 RepID=A0A2P7QW12_9SPHN|nr:hypothetical protein [Sphingomonas deserti]PSJ42139.1 hypothetical protein C7I55_07855 [Sphingomonas deserti]